MGDWAYRVLALLVVGGIVFYAIRAYHQRELARIETAELELDEFVKIALGGITFAWQCPHCGTPLLTAEALMVHRAIDSSACARTVEQAQAEQALAEVQQDPGGYSMSATQVPDVAVTTAELEE
jgi:hypothetical protein